MRNLTIKLGAGEDSKDELLKTFEFEKELAKVSYCNARLEVGFSLLPFFLICLTFP